MQGIIGAIIFIALCVGIRRGPAVWRDIRTLIRLALANPSRATSVAVLGSIVVVGAVFFRGPSLWIANRVLILARYGAGSEVQVRQFTRNAIYLSDGSLVRGHLQLLWQISFLLPYLIATSIPLFVLIGLLRRFLRRDREVLE